MEDKLTPGKLFYSITEVAEMFNVNASLIRFWDKEFTIIKPRKNAKGNRQFTVEDILSSEYKTVAPDMSLGQVLDLQN